MDTNIPTISSLRLVPLVLSRDGSQSNFRWFVLLVISFVMLCILYCNNFVALEDELTSKFGLTSVEYLSLFSVYSFPNIVLPIFGGMLIDKIDAEYAALLFLFVEIIGQSLFSIACTISPNHENYLLMLSGRFIFGLGGESLHAATYTIIGEYFKGKELAFAMSIRQSFARMGSSLNDFITPLLDKRFNSVSITLWIGSLMIFIGIILVIILIFSGNAQLHNAFKKNRYLKNHFEQMKSMRSFSVLPALTPIYGSVNSSKPLNKNKQIMMPHNIDTNVNSNINNSSSSNVIRVNVETTNRKESPSLTESGMSESTPITLTGITNRDGRDGRDGGAMSLPRPSRFVIKPTNETINENSNSDSDTENDSLLNNNNNNKCCCFGKCNQFSALETIESFPFSYWLFVLCSILLYGTAITWNETAVSELYLKYNHLTYAESSNLLTIFWILSAIFTPIFGFLADRIGHLCQFIIVGGILLSITHLFIYLPFKTNPLIIILFLGLGFSIFPAAIFPGIATVIHKRHLGTAYGILFACFNCALTIIPMIVGNIIETDKINGFKKAELLFVGLSVMSVICGIILYVDDICFQNSVLTNNNNNSDRIVKNENSGNDKNKNTTKATDERDAGNCHTEKYWKNIISTPCDNDYDND